MGAVVAAAVVVYVTLDLRTVAALLTRQRARNGNNCDENVGALCDAGDALLVVMREMREAAEEVVDPKHHDPARDLLARARLRAVVAVVKDE